MKKLFLFFLAVSFLAFGCGKKSAPLLALFQKGRTVEKTLAAGGGQEKGGWRTGFT